MGRALGGRDALTQAELRRLVGQAAEHQEAVALEVRGSSHPQEREVQQRAEGRSEALRAVERALRGDIVDLREMGRGR